MLTDYIQAAMNRATYEILEDDNTYFGQIPGCQGVWANEDILAACRKELQSALEDWILAHLIDHTQLPIIDGIDLNTSVSEPEVGSRRA